MNDYKENYVLIEKLKEYLKNRNDIPEDYLNKLDETIRIKFRLNTPYVFCLTELNDSLSQWRAYGNDGEGICFKIDSKKLEMKYRLPFSGVEKDNNLSLHNVIYSNEEIINIIEDILNESIEFSKTRDENIKNIVFAENACALMVRFSPVVKLNEFREEKEWRIIYNPVCIKTDSIPFNTLDNNKDIGFVTTNNNLRSYFKISFTSDEFKDIISAIYIGPKSRVHYYEMRILLDINALKNTEIYHSKIPYR